MNPEILRTRINSLASQKIPFLFAVDFELTGGFLIEQPLAQKEVLFRTPIGSNEEKKRSYSGENPQIKSFPDSYLSYLEKFNVVMRGLQRGDSFLTNLTVKTEIETAFSFQEIFQFSTAPYGLYVPGQFVCFSPERFVHIADGIISTHPMKGTVNAAIPNAREKVLGDKKETAEHNTIVDLLRNDLGMVGENITVKRFRYIEKVTTHQSEILQVSSEIVGRLKENFLSQLGDIIFKMLPAGSVSGAPKNATLDIIRRAEQQERGYYTGIFGYFDGRVLDSAVMIRFIEEKNGKKYFRSGGGVTVMSDPMSEYKEFNEKIYLPFP